MPRNGWRRRRSFHRCASPGAPEKTSLPPWQLGPPMAWTMMLSTNSRRGPEVVASAGHGAASTTAAAISMCLDEMDRCPSVRPRPWRGLMLLAVVAHRCVAIVLTDHRHRATWAASQRSISSGQTRHSWRGLAFRHGRFMGLRRKAFALWARRGGRDGYWTTLRRDMAGVQIQVIRSLTTLP